MPKIKQKFASADAIPAELKPFANDQHEVEMWVGDNVAGETNPALEAQKNQILAEKKTLKEKYDTAIKASGDLSTEVMELRQKVASGSQVSPDEVALIGAVKAVMPTVKPDELKKELEALPQLRGQVAEIQTKERNRKLFAASGFKNQTVFMDLIGNKDKNPNLVETVLETETVDNKPVEKAYAKVKQQDGTIAKQPLQDYVKANSAFTDYLPLLDAGAPNQDQYQHQWPIQPPTGGNGSNPNPGTGNTGDDPLQAHINKMNEAAKAVPNPLLKNPAAPAGSPKENPYVPGLHVPQN